MAKVVLASLRRKRGWTLAALAAECRKHDGGKGINVPILCAYFAGSRAIGPVHLRLLCEVLRVDPKDVCVNQYLAGGRAEPVAVK